MGRLGLSGCTQSMGLSSCTQCNHKVFKSRREEKGSWSGVASNQEVPAASRSWEEQESGFSARAS